MDNTRLWLRRDGFWAIGRRGHEGLMNQIFCNCEGHRVLARKLPQ